MFVEIKNSVIDLSKFIGISYKTEKAYSVTKKEITEDPLFGEIKQPVVVKTAYIQADTIDGGNIRLTGRIENLEAAEELFQRFKSAYMNEYHSFNIEATLNDIIEKKKTPENEIKEEAEEVERD